MKYQTIISLILLPQLAPALGAVVTTANNGATDLRKRNILGHIDDKKAKVLKVAGNGIKVSGKGAHAAGKGVKITGKGAKVAGNGIKFGGGKGIKAASKGGKVVVQGIKNLEGGVQKTFVQAEADDDAYYEIFDELGDAIPTCAKQDCKDTVFMNEAMRWVKQAVKDVGVVIHDNPAATTALIIGVSVLITELISGGMLIPAALRAAGFGAKGPIKNTLAAAVQRVINPVKLGSMFSRFQSAAMGGAAISELKRLARTAVTALIGIGVAGLVSGGVKPHGHLFAPAEWRNWVSESRVDTLSNFTSNTTQLWGTPTYGGCVAYGYRDIRAPLLLVPESMDPMTACTRTPALIEGLGYKTPLDCVDEGSEKGVIGIWYIPTNMTQCMPKWGIFEDEGCVLYGQRRMFGRLMGLGNNVDWKNMCESTPATVGDKHYSQPSYCDDKGVLGIYGVFHIADEQCECSCAHT
ncbi:hypothetical protein OPQ81_003655 [Rhizoctonia solani]|nr:hypothetical protein OPQ81_003655 [Rhizoctonia solani]